MNKLLFLAIVTVLLSGCSSSYLIKKPHVMPACNQNQSRNLQDYASVALIDSLLERHWTILGVDTNRKTVSAKACRQRFCANFDFRVAENGKIDMFRTTKMPSDYEGYVKRWVGLLDSAYANKCFNTYEGLVADLKSKGFDYEATVSGHVTSNAVIPAKDAD